MNRGQIRDFVERMIPETDAVTAELNILIEQGHMDIAKWCRLIVDNDSTAGVEGESDVDLHARFLRFDDTQRPTYNSKPLEWKTVQELQGLYGEDLDDETGEPLYISMNEDFTSVRLVPYPDSDNAGSGESLILPQILRPTELSTDLSVPWDDKQAFYPYHILIAWYVVKYENIGAGFYQRAAANFQMEYAPQLQELMIVANYLREGRSELKAQVDIGDYNP
jgi:hypothetical protein